MTDALINTHEPDSSRLDAWMPAYFEQQPRGIRLFDDQLQPVWRSAAKLESWLQLDELCRRNAEPAMDSGPEVWPVRQALASGQPAEHLYCLPQGQDEDSREVRFCRMRAWVLTDSRGARLVVEETELIEPRSFAEERIEQLDSELAKLITDVVHVQSKWDEAPDFSHLRLSNPYLQTPHVRTTLHCDCPVRRTEQSERCWELPPGSVDEPRTLSLTAQQLFGHCDHCDVFKCATPDPLTRLAENINRLVSLLEYDHQEMLHAQQEVLQADKRFLVGELVLGLAHEIKTPLSVIIGRLDCLKMELDSISPAELAADLNVLQEHAWRMRGVLESVFNMARPAAPKFRIIRPADEIARMLSLLRKTLEQAELEVQWSCAEDADEIYADPEQLQQVLLNLMLNARDAMPGGGSLTLTVHRQHGERSGVVISIRDTGEGIAPDQINRIFSPFFSTKTNHGGTGLGLAVCQRIMIQHGGLISVESRPGEGATFSLWFPESREVAAAP